jgi:hypothetical protein
MLKPEMDTKKEKLVGWLIGSGGNSKRSIWVLTFLPSFFPSFLLKGFRVWSFEVMSIIPSYKKHPSIHPSAYLFLLKTHQLAQPPPRQILSPAAAAFWDLRRKRQKCPQSCHLFSTVGGNRRRRRRRRKKEEEEDVPKFASLCMIKLVAIMSGDDRKIQFQKNFGMMFQSQKIDFWDA